MSGCPLARTMGYPGVVARGQGEPWCPVKPKCRRRFLLNSGVEPSFPNFLSGNALQFCHLHFSTTSFSYKYVNFPHYSGKKLHFSLCQKCSVAQIPKYAKNELPTGLRSGPRWGSSRRSPDPVVGWSEDNPMHPTQRLRHLNPRALRRCSSTPSAFRCSCTPPKPGAPPLL